MSHNYASEIESITNMRLNLLFIGSTMRKVWLIILSIVISSSLLAEDDADFLAGFEAYRKSDYELALKHFSLSAELGNKRSQNNLGWMYYHGQGTTKDYDKSFFWYQKAEACGEPLVLYMLGQSYLFGRGTDIDKNKAFEYFHKAYGKGLPVADLRVGLDFYFGISTDKNIEKARVLINSAAMAGHPAAQFFAGYLELELNNTEKAVYWLKASDKQNYHLAKLLLAEIAQNNGAHIQAVKEIVSAMPLLTTSNVTFEVKK